MRKLVITALAALGLVAAISATANAGFVCDYYYGFCDYIPDGGVPGGD